MDSTQKITAWVAIFVVIAAVTALFALRRYFRRLNEKQQEAFVINVSMGVLLLISVGSIIIGRLDGKDEPLWVGVTGCAFVAIFKGGPVAWRRMTPRHRGFAKYLAAILGSLAGIYWAIGSLSMAPKEISAYSEASRRGYAELRQRNRIVYWFVHTWSNMIDTWFILGFLIVGVVGPVCLIRTLYKGPRAWIK